MVAVLTGALLWVGACPGAALSTGIAAARGCPDESSPAAMGQVLENPESFIGCRITIQGTLYRRQGVYQIQYSIQTGSGQGLEVWPWAPEEPTGRPREEETPEGDRTMSSYIGQELRIEGRVVPGRQGGAVLEVSIVEEVRGDPG